MLLTLPPESYLACVPGRVMTGQQYRRSANARTCILFLLRLLRVSVAEDNRFLPNRNRRIRATSRLSTVYSSVVPPERPSCSSEPRVLFFLMHRLVMETGPGMWDEQSASSSQMLGVGLRVPATFGQEQRPRPVSDIDNI
jgi:hypothetical protein